MDRITISEVGTVDPSDLAELRLEAMQPSLEAVGRFDPDRARHRFLETYDPKDTRVVWAGDKLIGFFVVRRHPDHLYLDHLYIGPTYQGSGVGRTIVDLVQERARDWGLPVRLTALVRSPANDFYLSCGFVFEQSDDDLDNLYVWQPT